MGYGYNTTVEVLAPGRPTARPTAPQSSTHEARAGRRRNATRRKLAADKQRPLPLSEQTRRSELRAAANRAKYPHPPTYVTRVSSYVPKEGADR